MGTRLSYARAAGWAGLALAGGALAFGAKALTIHDLQVSSAAQEWKSAYEGQIVSLTGGVVTHVAGFRITLQDPTLGDAWAGLEIRAYESETPLGVVRVGDRVDFHDILVEEFRGGTIPQFKSYSDFEVLSSGNPLPEPVLVPLADIANPPDRERCERYEGMLVTIENVRVGQMDLGKAEDNYELSDGAHTAWGSDYYNLDLAVPPFPKYFVARGERYARITGVFQEYSNPAEGWDYYQILPRGAGDYERSEIYTIRDVQECTAEDGWASLLAGTRVSVQGVVSAERSASGRLALCDRLLGPAWSGILVSDPTGGLAALGLGDEVLLEQVLVVESGGQTRLLYDGESDQTVTGAGGSASAFGLEPSVLALGAGAEVSEPYEGMLIALYNVSVARRGVPEGDSLYYLAAEADTLLATDADCGVIPPGSAFFVRTGDRLGRIRGLVLERELPEGGRAYVLAPRSSEDYYFTTKAGAIYTSWGRLKGLFR
jgi:hypothetical protein